MGDIGSINFLSATKTRSSNNYYNENTKVQSAPSWINLCIHVAAPFTCDDRLPSLKTRWVMVVRWTWHSHVATLTIVGNNRLTNLSCTSTSLNCKWPTWPCENEKQVITRGKKAFSRNLRVENLWSSVKTSLESSICCTHIVRWH